MRALSHLDVSDNELGQLVPPEGWTRGDYIPSSGDKYHWTHTDGRKEGGVVPSESKPGGIIALANVIPGMGALLRLDISNNQLVFATKDKLKPNGWTEKRCAADWGKEDDHWEWVPDCSGVVALANAIKDNGTTTKFNISGCKLFADGGKALAVGLKGNQVITELNISDNFLSNNSDHNNDTSGIFAIADAIPDISALTSLDISANSIGWGSDLYQQIMQKVGCNKLMLLLADTTLTELDVSGIGFGSEGAVAVAKYISDNGAMTSLNLADNDIGGYYTDKGHGNEKFHSTPEGVVHTVASWSFLIPLSTFRRPSCYR
jgi:hypothetical protein